MGEVVQIVKPQKTGTIHPILYAQDLTPEEFGECDIGDCLFSATVLIRTPDIRVYELDHFTALAASGQKISLTSFVKEDEVAFSAIERLIFDIVKGVVVSPINHTQTNQSDIYVNYQLTQQAICGLVQRYVDGENKSGIALIGGTIKEAVFLDVPHQAYEASNLPKQKISFAKRGHSKIYFR